MEFGNLPDPRMVSTFKHMLDSAEISYFPVSGGKLFYVLAFYSDLGI